MRQLFIRSREESCKDHDCDWPVVAKVVWAIHTRRLEAGGDECHVPRAAAQIR